MNFIEQNTYDFVLPLFDIFELKTNFTALPDTNGSAIVKGQGYGLDAFKITCHAVLVLKICMVKSCPDESRCPI